MTTAKTRGEGDPKQGRHGAQLDAGEARAVILAAAALAIFLYFIKLILLPFILPAILAYICTPAIDWLSRRTRWPRLVFAIGFFLVILGIGILFGVFAAGRVADEARSLAFDLQGTLQKLVGDATGNHPVQIFGHIVDPQQIVKLVLDRLADWIGQTDQLALFASVGLALIAGFFLCVVLLFYFLASGESIARGLLWMVPPHRRGLVRRIWARLDPVLTRYFVGMIAVVIYATSASYVGLGFFLDIHHAVLLALLTGVLETVPFIGPMAAAILAGLVSLQTATGFMSILDYALYATALRLSIDQLIGPIVLGAAARLHPVLIIFCFLAGGVVFGIPGVILAVPVALLIKSTLATLYGDESA
ncbi:MAG: AI-2E family transporter [Xanthobacteraceae bacterium]|jgi:predicted PurR-regulated permease PerM